MPLPTIATLPRGAAQFRAPVLALLFIAATPHCILAQFPASVTAPSGYLPCADSASSTPPEAESSPYVVQDTLNSLYEPAAGSAVVASAHRGLWQNSPENSMTAIYAGLRNILPINEVDVFATDDTSPGPVVLAHDNDVARTTTGTGLISGMSAKAYTALYLRDRHGCPTNEHPVTLSTVISNLIQYGQIYRDDEGQLAGSLLVVDVKSASGSSSAAVMYQTLLDSIHTWETEDLGGYGPVQSLVFKVPMYTGGSPVMPLPTDCDSKGNCGYHKFVDDIEAQDGASALIPNMIYVLYAPSSTDPTNTYFEEYDQPWSFSGGGTLGFETHERYLSDQSTAMRQFLQKEGRAVGAFSPDNFFPEGDPSGNICCKYFSLNLNATAQPQCLSGGVGSCLDERVRWDLFTATGAGLITAERPLQIYSFLRAAGKEGSVTQDTPLTLPAASSATCSDPGDGSSELCQ